MKKDIHPKYYENAVIKCACGNEFIAGSVKEHLNIEVCGACHPLYSGKERFLDKAGRVEKFKMRTAAKKEKTVKAPRKKVNAK